MHKLKDHHVPVILLILGTIGYFILSLFPLDLFVLYVMPRIIIMTLSNFCLVLGLAWICTTTEALPEVKILDWCLMGFILLLMPCFEILGLPMYFWMLLTVFPTAAARITITGILQSNRLHSAIYLVVFIVGMIYYVYIILFNVGRTIS